MIIKVLNWLAKRTPWGKRCISVLEDAKRCSNKLRVEYERSTSYRKSIEPKHEYDVLISRFDEIKELLEKKPEEE